MLPETHDPAPQPPAAGRGRTKARMAPAVRQRRGTGARGRLRRRPAALRGDRRRGARARAPERRAALLRWPRPPPAAAARLGGAALRPVLAASRHHFRAAEDPLRAAVRAARLPDRLGRPPYAAPAATRLRAGPRLRAARRTSARS